MFLVRPSSGLKHRKIHPIFRLNIKVTEPKCFMAQAWLGKKAKRGDCKQRVAGLKKNKE